jgi:hypothetical protein
MAKFTPLLAPSNKEMRELIADRLDEAPENRGGSAFADEYVRVVFNLVDDAILDYSSAEVALARGGTAVFKLSYATPADVLEAASVVEKLAEKCKLHNTGVRDYFSESEML